MEHLATSALLRCISPSDIDTRNTSRIPGRGDLRVSLTTRCNLQCEHCHNEGRSAPWNLDESSAATSLDSVEELIALGARYGAKSVKFTGGEPTSFREFPQLLDRVATWRRSFPEIENWGISTNGIAFLKPELFERLANSELDNICIGIDSVRGEDLSKPSSPNGVTGRHLLDAFVRPLAGRWPDRKIKLNVVFTGDTDRVLGVIDAALSVGVEVSVIEINSVMEQRRRVREGFFALMNYVAGLHRLTPRLYEPLNEIYLHDGKGKARIKFYQDHCADRDCGACRNIHLRVAPQADGWASVPCFLLAQASLLSLMEDGVLSAPSFEQAIRYNGMGPEWRGVIERSSVMLTVKGEAAPQEQRPVPADGTQRP